MGLKEMAKEPKTTAAKGRAAGTKAISSRGDLRGDHAAIAATLGRGIRAAVLCTVAAVPIVPAVLINLDQAAGKGLAWTAFAIASVGAAALCVELVREARTWSGRGVWAVIAALFLALNVANAIGNSAVHSGDVRDNRAAIKADRLTIASRIAALSHRRETLAAVAGEDTAEAIAAEAAAKKAEGATRWRATDGCSLDKITAGPSREFCASISRLEARKSAAEKRDAVDAELAEVRKKDTGTAPSSADPQAESIAQFIEAFGFAVDAHGREVIASSMDWGKGIGVEVLAAFLPAGLLSLLSKRPAELPASPKIAAKRAEQEPDTEPAQAPAPVLDEDTEITAFFTRHLEPAQGSHVQPGPLFAAWVAHCTATGIEPGSAKAFSARVQRKVAYERNNGRPRYCHVRLRETQAPRLAVVR